VVIGNRSCQDNSAQIRTPPSREASGAAGVSPPCVALTYLHRRFRNCSADCRRCVGARSCHRVRVTTGGLRPPLLFARVRPPTELRLLRCTHAHAAGAAGVSPPRVALTYLHRRYRSCSAHCRPACWRTPLRLRCRNHGGLTPPLLFVRRSPADGIATFTMRKRTCTGAAGVNPPCDRETPLQRRHTQSRRHIAPATKSGGCQSTVCRADVLAQALPQLFGRLSSLRWCTQLPSRSCNHGGPYAHRSRWRMCVRTSQKSHFPCECVDRSPRGAYAPRSCSRAFARRRICDFCDAQTHTHQERRV